VVVEDESRGPAVDRAPVLLHAVDEALAGWAVRGREDDAPLDVAVLERRPRPEADVDQSPVHLARRRVRECERLEAPLDGLGHRERAVSARPDGEVEVVDGRVACAGRREGVGGEFGRPALALVARHTVVEFGECGEYVPRRLVGPRPSQRALDRARPRRS